MASSDEPEGGGAACWLDRTCPDCGHLEDGDPPAVCPRCGSHLDDRDATLLGPARRNRQATDGDLTAG